MNKIIPAALASVLLVGCAAPEETVYKPEVSEIGLYSITTIVVAAQKCADLNVLPAGKLDEVYDAFYRFLGTVQPVSLADRDAAVDRAAEKVEVDKDACLANTDGFDYFINSY